jgi:hypothetical protein
MPIFLRTAIQKVDEEATVLLPRIADQKVAE